MNPSPPVAADHVVVLTFATVEPDGEPLDERWVSEPYAFIFGQKQMPEGFEQGIQGLQAGDLFEFDVPCERAYGPHNSQHVQKVARSQLPPDLRQGMVVRLEVPGLEGIAPPLLFHVKRVTPELVHLDGNHPFAGKDLRFIGKIRRVRPATGRERLTGRIQRGDET